MHLFEIDQFGEKAGYSATNENRVRGISLLKSKLDSSRVAWSFGGVSGHYRKNSMVAMHEGTSSNLVMRSGWPKSNSLAVLKHQDIVGLANKSAKFHFSLSECKLAVNSTIDKIDTIDVLVAKMESMVFLQCENIWRASWKE